MSAVEVTITGVLYDKLSRTGRPVTLIGEAVLTNLGVGGGPIIPEGPVDPGWGVDEGAGIWPSPGRPTHPIAPGGRPPGIWGGSGSLPRPERPVDPGYGIDEGTGLPNPPPDGADKPPPEGSAGWGYVHEWSRWGFFPAQGDKPHPPGSARPPGTPTHPIAPGGTPGAPAPAPTAARKA